MVDDKKERSSEIFGVEMKFFSKRGH